MPDETAILSDDAQPLGHQCGQRKQSHDAQLWTKGGFSRVPSPRMQREHGVVHISDVFKECVDVVFKLHCTGATSWLSWRPQILKERGLGLAHQLLLSIFLLPI